MIRELKPSRRSKQMNFITWVVVGIIIGRVANLFIGTRENLLLDIIAGIVGASVLGLGLTPLLRLSLINQNNFSLSAVLVSMGGAVILLTVLTMFRRRGYLLR
jgi:uncharacterized membrane protein YeaQ/YmgE (transglycosylase-associated protein family)